jgi:HAD superfamily hydrolase (TIGR01509 family)
VVEAVLQAEVVVRERTAAYDIAQLRTALARFNFLLGGDTDGDLFQPQPPPHDQLDNDYLHNAAIGALWSCGHAELSAWLAHLKTRALRCPVSGRLPSVEGQGRIRGVMFDAGGVLTRPIGGRWNPRYDFENIVMAHHPEVRDSLFPAAFAVGQRFLDAGTATANRTDYHRAMLAALGIDRPSEQLLRQLEAPAAGPVIELYPDVRRVLEQLREWGVRMSIVSDNWAGLEATFAGLDIQHYFEGFAISEILGCRKPDPRMYAEGSRLLGLKPRECLFIDDDPQLVAAAEDLGYHGDTLDRDAQRTAAGDVIVSLDYLLPIVAGKANHR